jgi:hypothetical protein
VLLTGVSVVLFFGSASRWNGRQGRRGIFK